MMCSACLKGTFVESDGDPILGPDIGSAVTVADGNALCWTHWLDLVRK